MARTFAYMVALVASLVGSSAATFSAGKSPPSRGSTIGGFFGASVGANLSSLNTSSYRLVQSCSGSDFFDGWWFFNNSSPGAPDPTHGAVNYTDINTAGDNKLAGFIWNNATNLTTAYLSVDHKHIQAKRNSVRIISEASWSNGAIFVADVVHTPLGYCGTWPSLWLLGSGRWPMNGEIDIIEGVNDNQYNSLTLHTDQGCVVNNARSSMTGNLQNDNCWGEANDNAACGIRAPFAESFNHANNLTARYPTAGHGFNNMGGGVYATVWTDEGISIYMFPRLNTPKDILADRPDPSSWTVKPLAKFAGSGCDFKKKFSELSLVVNTDLCGDWAGGVWNTSNCAKKYGGMSCEKFVENHPEAFKDAYWNIKSIKVYQTSSGSSYNPAKANGNHTKRDGPSRKLPWVKVRSEPVSPNWPLPAEKAHGPQNEEGTKTSSSVTSTASPKHGNGGHEHTHHLATVSTAHHSHGHGKSKFAHAHLHSRTTTRATQATPASDNSINGTVSGTPTSSANTTGNGTHQSSASSSGQGSSAPNAEIAGWISAALVLFIAAALM